MSRLLSNQMKSWGYFIILFFSGVSSWTPYSQSNRCTLNFFRGNQVVAGRHGACSHSGGRVVIEWNFFFAMNYLEQWAQNCGVKVHVCRSFVEGGPDMGGHPSATPSNNNVGHAVDVWLEDVTTSTFYTKWTKGNPRVDCFMEEVDNEPTIAWKQVELSVKENNQPRVEFFLHIDDGMRLNNGQYWLYLRGRLRRSCGFM